MAGSLPLRVQRRMVRSRMSGAFGRFNGGDEVVKQRLLSSLDRFPAPKVPMALLPPYTDSGCI
jgi:hypothetical protein